METHNDPMPSDEDLLELAWAIVDALLPEEAGRRDLMPSEMIPLETCEKIVNYLEKHDHLSQARQHEEPATPSSSSVPVLEPTCGDGQ